MKKIIFTFILFLLLSSCSKVDYSNDGEKILQIEDYIDEIQFDNETRTVYMSNESSRLYYFIENESEYKMIVEDSFYDKKLSYEKPKNNSTTTTSEELVKVDDFIIKYSFGSNIINYGKETLAVDKPLNRDSFINICFEYFNETKLCIKDTMKLLIEEAVTTGKISEIVKANVNNIGSCYIVHSKILLSKMKKNYESSKSESNYFNMIMKYIGEDKYDVFSSNILSLTMNVLGGAGSLDVLFYVSEDYTKVYPYLSMKNGEINFYNVDLFK